MNKFVCLALLSLISFGAFANDGGVAGVKVSEIKMREYQVNNGQESELRRIVKPNFKIFFSGGEARQLQKALPSVYSVLTSMQPEIAEIFNESFKTLAIYSDKSDAASSKIINISCNDAEMKFDDNGKVRIVKTGKSTCEITINGLENDENVNDYLGDVSPFEPKTCERR